MEIFGWILIFIIILGDGLYFLFYGIELSDNDKINELLGRHYWSVTTQIDEIEQKLIKIAPNEDWRPLFKHLKLYSSIRESEEESWQKKFSEISIGKSYYEKEIDSIRKLVQEEVWIDQARKQSNIHSNFTLTSIVFGPILISLIIYCYMIK